MQGQILVAQLNLADLSSVASFAQQLSQEPRVDALICNAGVMACPLSYTKDGFECQIGTNHFGHFYLFQLLEGKLASQVRMIDRHICSPYIGWYICLHNMPVPA